MNKAPLLFITCISCLLFSSCLTIEETYRFNKNGSGWMEYKIETEDLAELMETFSQEVGEDKPGFDPEKLSMRNLMPGLEKIDGLSAVNLIDAPEDNEYGVSFKFQNIGVLNRALNHILMEEKDPFYTYFKMDGNVITRSHKMTKNTIGGEFLEKAEGSEPASAFLQKMDYKIRYSFKQSIRVAYGHSESTIIGKKSKDLQVETDLGTLLKDPEALNTSIVLK